MMNKEISRKEFLGVLGTVLGAVILSRLPFSGAAKSLMGEKRGSYGNETYGGKKKK